MENVDGGPDKYILSHNERKNPQTNWEECWELARLHGLGPENTSFLFKLLHNTLINQERLSRTNPKISSLCKFPGCPGTDVENLPHALVLCHGNNGVGTRVMQTLQSFVPGLGVEEALRLDFTVEESLRLPLVFALAVAFGAIWDLRLRKTRPQLYLVRAQLEAKVSLLRECRRFTNDATIIDNFINTL